MIAMLATTAAPPLAPPTEAVDALRWIPMTVALVVALGYFSWVMYGKTMLLFKAQHRPDLFRNIPKRISNVLLIAIGQRKIFKEKGPGILHALTFWGFLVLSIRSLYLIIYAFDPNFTIPLIHNPYSLAKDVAEVVVLTVVLIALFRRIFLKPERLTLSMEANVVLMIIAALMVTDFFIDAFLFAGHEVAGTMTEHLREEMAYSPVGGALSHLVAGMSPAAMRVGFELSYWAHVLTLLTFLNMLPGSKHFHVLTSLPNVFFGEVKAKGALLPIPDIDEQEYFGAGKVTDLSWRNYLDLYSCTECGRCAVNCPTTITGKPLNPKYLICDVRDFLYEREPEVLGRVQPPDPDERPGLLDAVGYETIWACTTCRACDEACPVMIERVGTIIDFRRYLVLMEANLPKEMATTLRNLETKGNPWGLPKSDRMEWADGLDVPLIADKPDAEYLFWVGCAGAYDDRQKKVSRNLVELMREAGVSFAVLGEDESCTGDSARRAGNEYLFQSMAKGNIELLNGFGVDKKKIVTHCPHCLNTLLNEYPQFGGNYEVVHHTELLDQLVAQGKLKPKKKPEGAEKVVYHDPCYLGRHNDVYEEPRRVVQAIPGLELREMTRNRTTAMCCGAGGARVWMEEHLGERINQVRVEQAMDKEPDTIAVACPFCNMMLDDGTKEKGVEGVRTRDISDLLLESIKG